MQRANGVRAAGRPLPRLRPQGPKPRQVKGPDQQALLIPEPPEGQPEQPVLKPEPVARIRVQLVQEPMPVQKLPLSVQQAY